MSSTAGVIGSIFGIIVSLVLEFVGISILAQAPAPGAELGWAFIGGGSLGIIGSIISLLRSF